MKCPYTTHVSLYYIHIQGYNFILILKETQKTGSPLGHRTAEISALALLKL